MKQATFITKARGIFEDNNGARTIPRQRSGSGLDMNAVALADAGERGIYTKRERRLFSDYQIGLLIDVSGSMSRSKKDEYAAKTAHALYYSLREGGAKVRAWTYNQYFKVAPDKVLESGKKTWDLVSDLCRKNGLGGNHDGYALRQAAAAVHKESRSPAKIILVFSDGQASCDERDCGRPGCSKSEKGLQEDLHAAIRQVRRSGIVVLALGIVNNLVTEYYGSKQSRIVTDLSALYSQAAGLLEQNIRRG